MHIYKSRSFNLMFYVFSLCSSKIIFPPLPYVERKQLFYSIYAQADINKIEGLLNKGTHFKGCYSLVYVGHFMFPISVYFSWSRLIGKKRFHQKECVTVMGQTAFTNLGLHFLKEKL